MKRKYARGLAALFALALIAVAAYAFYEPYRLEIKEYTVESHQLPQEFDGKTIAFLSDLHYDGERSGKWIKRVVDATNAQRPDIVLLGGDYITGGEELLDEAFSILGRLESATRTFCVIGNHEWPYAERYRAAAEKNGITPVDNTPSRVFIGTESVVIAGSEFYLKKMPDMSRLARMADEEDFVIYLQHNPDFAEVAEDPRIDVMLSGHNHGGQVTLFGLFAPYLPSKYGQKYRTGMVEGKGFPVIVSNGIGIYKVPLRLGARPQVVLVHLEKSE